MKIIIVIPTLNEKKNVDILIKKILKISKNFDLLFIDDNSNDGTQAEIIKKKRENNRIKYIFRKRKFGVGSAHKDGLIYAYRKGYKIAITMDSDGTHDPKYIPILIRNLYGYSLVITNRFKLKDSLKDWPLFRKILTNARYYLINFLLNISYDTSGAFRCYDLNKIKKRDILLAKNNSYSFFWESTFILHKKKYKIKDIPVNLPSRKLGSSKMKFRDILGALLYLFFYSVKRFIKL
jgi:dolichol-phosphate mannosyltransferase